MVEIIEVTIARTCDVIHLHLHCFLTTRACVGRWGVVPFSDFERTCQARRDLCNVILGLTQLPSHTLLLDGFMERKALPFAILCRFLPHPLLLREVARVCRCVRVREHRWFVFPRRSCVGGRSVGRSLVSKQQLFRNQTHLPSSCASLTEIRAGHLALLPKAGT